MKLGTRRVLALAILIPIWWFLATVRGPYWVRFGFSIVAGGCVWAALLAKPWAQQEQRRRASSARDGEPDH